MIARRELAVDGRPATVWMGGAGEPLLLVHGAWGGAELHFGPVWERLAARYLVLAPELPGIGVAPALSLADPSPPDALRARSSVPTLLGTIDALAGWLFRLLDALALGPAWYLGNSLGAALSWQLAGRLPPRGLVLVNGPPPQPTPSLVRRFGESPRTRPLAMQLYRRLSFSPPVLARAFADPARAPAELVRTLASPAPARLEVLLDLIARGATAAPAPDAPILLLWGEGDRLPGTGASVARRLHRSLVRSGVDAALALVPDAGHCPQLEQPSRFVDALLAFTDSARLPMRAARGG